MSEPHRPGCCQTRYCAIFFNPAQGAPDDFRASLDQRVEEVARLLGRWPKAPIAIRLTDTPRRSAARWDTSTIFISRDKLPHRSNIFHELTHILAGRGSSKLLEEGLAVFVQAKLGGAEDRSFPMDGRDLHEETARALTLAGQVLPLTAEPYIQPRQMQDTFRRLAYLQAGSFVRFLAEMHDQQNVLHVYDGGDWEAAFGEPLPALEARWRSMLALKADRPLEDAASIGPAPAAY